MSTMFKVVYWHENRAPESGVQFMPMALISAAGFWSVCQGPAGGNAVQLGM